MLQGCLRGDEHAAHVEVNYVVHLFQRRLFEGLWNGCAGVVHKHVQFAERGNGLLNRTPACADVDRISLDGECFSACIFNRLDHGRS